MPASKAEQVLDALKARLETVPIVVEECSFPRHFLLSELERYVEEKDEERACDGERVKLRTDEDADSAGKQKRRGGSEIQYLFCL
jgi:hypothetical protein